MPGAETMLKYADHPHGGAEPTPRNGEELFFEKSKKKKRTRMRRKPKTKQRSRR
jgi:hypothetical protein